jgi:nicotinamide riboside transporter PnuC
VLQAGYPNMCDRTKRIGHPGVYFGQKSYQGTFFIGYLPLIAFNSLHYGNLKLTLVFTVAMQLHFAFASHSDRNGISRVIRKLSNRHRWMSAFKLTSCHHLIIMKAVWRIPDKRNHMKITKQIIVNYESYMTILWVWGKKHLTGLLMAARQREHNVKVLNSHCNPMENYE